MKQTESGASEVLDETLIIALGIVCAVVTVMLVFGVFPNLQKTAYIVPQYNIKNISGHAVITIFERAGDPVYFNVTPFGSYTATVYVDTSSGSFTAIPAPGLTVFKPGDLVYLYYTGSRFIITGNLTGATITSLPAGQVSVRMIDANSGVIISQEIVVKGATATSPTTTATTAITTSATPPPGPLGANFDWEEQGKGGDVHFTDTSTGSPTAWSWNICGSTLISP